MVRKTRHSKHTHKYKSMANDRHSKTKTIPELRRSFEYIEDYVDAKISKHESKENIIKSLCKEWKKVFMKDLNKSASESMVSWRMNQKKKHSPRTIRHRGGASQMLVGAPIDHSTHPGVYVQPGQIPSNSGSTYGNYIEHVNGGFWNPMIGQTLDPLVQQSPWPVPYKDTGSNLFSAKGGRRTRKSMKGSKGMKGMRGTRGTRGGSMFDTAGATLTQAFNRPIPSSMPATNLQNMQDSWSGKDIWQGMSPDQVERVPPYAIGSLYPKTVTM